MVSSFARARFVQQQHHDHPLLPFRNTRLATGSPRPPLPNTQEMLTLRYHKATKADVEAHFATHGTGEITEIKLMNGFGFIEYKDAMDARDVVPGELTRSRHAADTGLSLTLLSQLSVRCGPSSMDKAISLNQLFLLANDKLKDGSDFMGERLTVQFARGNRHREGGGFNHERAGAAPRPRRTPHRMQITGLPNDTSWQVC
jgi:hypothetical protein